MCAVPVVVPNILREPAFQVAFVNCADVIQEIMLATPYPTLCDLQSILGITIKEDEETECIDPVGQADKSGVPWCIKNTTFGIVSPGGLARLCHRVL